MKKLIFLLIPLAILLAENLHSQVNIGALVPPANGAILDLNSAQDTSAVRGGLILSNVALKDTLTIPDLPGPFAKVTPRTKNDELAGTLVFNTTDDPCEGLIPGVYLWDGKRWRRAGNKEINCPATPDDSGNYALKGKTCYDVDQTDFCGDTSSRPNDFETTHTFYYDFENATGANYSNLTFSISDPNGLVKYTSRINEVLIITFVDNITDLATGKRGNDALRLKITARFNDNYNNLKTVSLEVKIQDCNCGCSVRALVPSGWLTFMCFNLGVSPFGESLSVEQQINYDETTMPFSLESTIYGNLWQWGRRTDGHESRDNVQLPGPFRGPFDLNGQVPPSSPFYGIYITAADQAPTYDWRDPHTENLWDGTTPTSDPCPDGWRVPDISDFWNIINGTSQTVNTRLLYDSYSGNRWEYVKGGNGKPAGWKISPNKGKTYTLFIPSAGHRSYRGGVINAGISGHYWTRTFKSKVNPYYFHYNAKGFLYLSDTNSRAYAYSVRCVSE